MSNKIDALTLISGVDIALPEIQVNLHQPRVREIAYIGEKNFYGASGILALTTEDFLEKNSQDMSEQDKIALSSMSNFELILTMINANPMVRNQMLMLLTLLFPTYMVNIEERFIMLINAESKKSAFINQENFSSLQDTIVDVLCLNPGNREGEYNPEGEAAKRIADKLKKAKEKISRLKGESNESSSMLSRYISGLGIGTNSLNILNCLDLTLYQLFNQLERFSLNESYKMSIQAKMAGAKDVDDVDWLKDI